MPRRIDPGPGGGGPTGPEGPGPLVGGRGGSPYILGGGSLGLIGR
jgi:hypothetical protein